MQMMKAAVVHEFGKPLVIEEVSVPEVVPGQVRDWQTEGLQWARCSPSDSSEADLVKVAERPGAGEHARATKRSFRD